MRAAAINATAQSRMSQPQNLFDKLPSNAGAKQHAYNQPIQEVLNLRHTLVPIAQGAIYAVIALRADGFMHGKLGLSYLIHLQPWGLQLLEALRRPELLGSVGKLLGRGVYPSNPRSGSLSQLVIASASSALSLICKNSRFDI